ncbi:hypothetical protein Q9R46_10895 [Paenibacillus sp. RRE4]|uniref:hypothetical protein n=1 Tax=Paenibacillus TaxID=44249 RepID=UPI001643064A|nr:MULTISPECIES: hypothetical protein [Paenibacillus]MDT0123149.1 hypothetical protein [Paenibacillus sp. RRE4]
MRNTRVIRLPFKVNGFFDFSPDVIEDCVYILGVTYAFDSFFKILGYKNRYIQGMET